jgi:hypothetical protein
VLPEWAGSSGFFRTAQGAEEATMCVYYFGIENESFSLNGGPRIVVLKEYSEFMATHATSVLMAPGTVDVNAA